MIKLHAKISEISLMLDLDVLDVVLRTQAGLFRRQHDWCAVRVIGADKMRCVALQSLRPHPDISLDIAQQVTQMDLTIGVGQGRCYKDLARHSGVHDKSWRERSKTQLSG